jgi:hypothetical protein
MLLVLTLLTKFIPPGTSSEDISNSEKNISNENYPSTENASSPPITSSPKKDLTIDTAWTPLFSSENSEKVQPNQIPRQLVTADIRRTK